MSRDTLLQQKKEKEEAQKELDQKYKEPASIKYDLFTDTGGQAGYAEYFPKSDSLIVNGKANLDGNILRSLRDVLNKLLDE